MAKHGFVFGLGFLASTEVQRKKNIPPKEKDLNLFKEGGLCKNINGIQTQNRQAILQGSANNCVLWKDHHKFSS